MPGKSGRRLVPIRKGSKIDFRLIAIRAGGKKAPNIVWASCTTFEAGGISQTREPLLPNIAGSSVFYINDIFSFLIDEPTINAILGLKFPQGTQEPAFVEENKPCDENKALF